MGFKLIWIKVLDMPSVALGCSNMKPTRCSACVLIFDWLVYFALFLIGIYFIQKDEVLEKFSQKRTNFARYQEPIVERPTITLFVDTHKLPLKFEKVIIKVQRSFMPQISKKSSNGKLE